MAIENMVIDPLADFGVLAARWEKDSRPEVESQKLVSFSTTSFGQVLLKKLAQPDRMKAAKSFGRYSHINCAATSKRSKH
ncbi:MAG: hypothetical protein GYA36_20450 [Veillonellaceae bacterium]|nr:hypothetical protein [Veillonellaceae bacterium]